MAHLGVRTATHKLIHYWKKNTYEMFDLTKDPTEQQNLLFGDTLVKNPEVADKFEELKQEIEKLQRQYQDDGQYAEPSSWPKGSADGPWDAYQASGRKTISEAIMMSVD
jgi:GrpB-like predicted nucleotidyltransferase (UPF0157 family)